MRLLHTSDWHLGRTFHGVSLLEQQVAVVDAIVDIVRSEGVDVVVVAGDLYDRQIPPADAVDALSEALARVRGAGASIVAISGNHDSPTRLRFGDRLLATAGVHIAGDVRAAGSPVVIDGVAIYPIPYLEPEVARHHLDVDAATHERVLRAALDRARADLAVRTGVRSVAVAHCFVAGGQPCDSERVLRVGGADRVPMGCFAGFDYVALGHLHGRQVFADGRMRYSGSPLPYSFSERDQRKSIELVDLAADGAVRAERIDLPQGRPLATIRGTLSDLLTERRWTAAEGAWVAATLVDQLLPRDAMARLRQRFPYAVTLTHEPPVTPGSDQRSYRERVAAARGDLELVADFMTHVTGAAPDDDDRHVCTSVIDEVAARVA